MAVNLNPQPIHYPPNARPQAQSLGVAAGAPALLRVPEIRQAAAVSNARAGGFYQPTAGRVLGQVLSPFSFVRTAGLSALLSFPLAAISNLADLQQGNVTQKQYMINTLADGFAYTTTGTLSSLVGALVGSLIPIPGLGTALGILGGLALGAVLGKLYDDQVRPSFRQSVATSLSQAGWLSPSS